jgi:hypothetical protein
MGLFVFLTGVAVKKGNRRIKIFHGRITAENREILK